MLNASFKGNPNALNSGPLTVQLHAPTPKHEPNKPKPLRDKSNRSGSSPANRADVLEATSRGRGSAD